MVARASKLKVLIRMIIIFKMEKESVGRATINSNRENNPRM
jgi:hypothetical protein